MPGVWLDTRYAAQNQIEIGVCVRCMTVLAVSDVSRLQWRQRSTTASPIRETAWLTMPLAVLTDKAFGPPDHLQVCGTRCVIRKKLDKVWQGSRECKFGNHNAEMISDSSLGSNRISMVRSINTVTN